MGDDASAILRDGITVKYELEKSDMMKLIIGYWLIGLCNNVGYVVALTAAHDLLRDHDQQISDKPADEDDAKKDSNRDCNVISTGAILLADIVPSIFVKVVAPFLPLMIKIRYLIIIGLSAAGFILIAFGFETLEASWIAITGIVFISLSSGLGESSALAYTAFFPTDNALSAWSSGTGGAGVIGATMYAWLREIGTDSKRIMMIMLMWPVIMAISFYILLPHPRIVKKKSVLVTLETATSEQLEGSIPLMDDPHTFTAKLEIIKNIFFIYTLPYCLTFFFEYIINQAFFELLYYPGDFLDKDSQYRWYQSVYQLGVFIGRSSMILVRIPYLYILAMIQFFNALFFVFEVLLGFLFFLGICIVLCFWEGLVAGTSYVNTYARMLSELPPLQREFSMSFNTLGDAISITLAGMLSIPIHNLLCTYKNPYETRIKKTIAK